MKAEAWVDAVAVIAPGLPDWAAARGVLRGEAPWRHAPAVVSLPAILPPAERRRTSLAVRVALSVGHQAIASSSFDGSELASVFASSGGDGTTCHLICEALAQDDRRVSPTQFHNSVHNAPAGYWGIAMRATPESTSLCGYDGSLACGLVEALAQVGTSGRPLILVAYDAPYPEPLRSCRAVADAFGVALVLSPRPTRPGSTRLAVTIDAGAPSTMADRGLEHLRASIPSAQALPLLALLAREATGTVLLPYLEPVDPAGPPSLLRVELSG
jgi:hypothetical protein